MNRYCLLLILAVSGCATPPMVGITQHLPPPAGLRPVTARVQDGVVHFASQPPATLRFSGGQCLLKLGENAVRLPMWPFADDGIPTDGAFSVESGAYDFACWQDESTLVISIGGSLTATRAEARYHFRDSRLERTERLIKSLDAPLRIESR
jgi:hypothetical protein